MIEHKISDKRWEMKGFWPWVPCKGTSMEIGNELMGVTEWLPATVPGGVHQDLYAAGLIDDPYMDDNSVKCEWVENRWWVYRTTFELPELKGERVELVFKGLDYEAIITLNQVRLGEHVGMYEHAVYDVTELLRNAKTAELQVVLKHPPDEMGQIGLTSQTFTQKSRFNYKWDFSTRLVNIGIWDDVLLRIHGTSSLSDISISTNFDGVTGQVAITADVRKYSATGSASVGTTMFVEATLIDPNGENVASVSAPVVLASDKALLGTGRSELAFTVEKPRLWYPNGYGEQPLYRLHLRLLEDEVVSDEHCREVGIRSLCYEKNPGGPADALPYTFVINGERIYIQGANLTPLDHLYGNIRRSHYEWTIRLAKHANMNMLRIWGGGLIEKDWLYELCDRHGILIWQEFIQSSSGIDNEPSKKPEFLTLLASSATHALKMRRNHVSLAVWSGGNELMSEFDRPSTYEDMNLAMLRELVAIHDPMRLFLPTSASGPVQYVTREKGVSHDVHGHWKYEGNPEHYTLYGEADYLFHSEFGVDGVSAVRSLRKFLSEPHLKPTSMRNDLVWRHHGEWWDTYDRDTALFGSFNDLADFADASQWMQAEGLRFILEANRRRIPFNSGSLVWQLNEPWPNASCTNLVDYYMEPKMAYYWVREAYRPDRISLDYRRLDYRPGETMHMSVYWHRRTGGNVLEKPVQLRLLDGRGYLLSERTIDIRAEPGDCIVRGDVELEAPVTEDGLFIVRLHVEGQEEPECDYFFSTAVQKIYRSAFAYHDADLCVEPEVEWERDSFMPGDGLTVCSRTYRVVNRGERAAMHIYPIETSDNYWMLANDAYFTLLPGESRKIKVLCTPRCHEVFTAARTSAPIELEPEIVFSCFGAKARVPQVNQALTHISTIN